MECNCFLPVLVLNVLLKKDIADYNILSLPCEIIKSMLQKGTLWQLWYLGALIVIYCFLPIIHKIVHKQNIITVCFALMIISAIIQISSYIAGYPIQKCVIQTFRLWTWFQYFILGYLLRKYMYLLSILR